MRPAYVFGKKSKHFYQYFKQSLEGKVVVAGNPDIIWSEVHIDDLIRGYLKIINGKIDFCLFVNFSFCSIFIYYFLSKI